MFYLRKPFSDMRELFIRTRNLFVSMFEPFIRARNQDIVRFSCISARGGFHYTRGLFIGMH